MSQSPTPAPAGDTSPILLVDDDATNLEVLRQTLGGSSYRLFVARTGEDAIKVARRTRPQLILLDVVMPGIDGYETCRRLKDDPETRDAAVIFLSALNDARDKVRGFEAGAVDFITKPFEGNEVIARVNTHLAIQRVLRRQAEARSPAASHERAADAPTAAHLVEKRPSGESVFQTGDVVAFRFRIVRYLARGGMGELYEAEDLELHERVALKTILSTIADDERSVLLFKREVHLARQVTHANVCRIYDVFRHRLPEAADGSAHEVVFLAMELLHGETLADKLQREGRLQTTDILPIARQMAAGLAAAHRAGVVHRDFKSHNVMLVKPDSSEQEMRVVITDFGLARRSAHDESTSFSLSLAETGEISGTPAYMAPEQVEGDAVTPATDVYAFGVVLYELVTGVWPFVAETPIRMAVKRLHEPPPSPRVHVPDVNPRWEATILRCLARQPADRFASASDVVSALEGAPASPDAAPAPTPTPFRSDSATPAVRRSSGEPERRQLTVLVAGCRVFESDAYLELDSEDQARVMRTFQERCDEAVGQFGGTVVQCTEEGLVACFGFPLAYEDAAGRAARTGLALLEAMRISNEPFRRADTLDLNPWVGIHTGPAIVEFKEGAVSLVGEARNIALRLENVAIAGQVICTDTSHRVFQGRFHCAPLGPQKIKGVTQPVGLFRVERIAVTGSLIEAMAPAELSPLTGRDHEINLLKDRWEQAQEGMGQVVLLIGEPGLGKSRLVHTMKQHVLGQMVEGEVDAPVIEWRCSPYFQNTGLYPAIDFYERALGFGREEAPQARFDRMVHRLEQYGLARPETVPLWASLLSLPMSDRFAPPSLAPVRQREDTFRAMLEWLHTRAAGKPVLFIVEDLHWVDASTLEFLGQFLAEGLHDRILTVLTFRPEFQTPWPAVAHQTSLALNRLTRRQVGDLMQTKMASALPDAVVEQVYDRTGGVPLFVEEFTKMVQESGLSQVEGSGRGHTLRSHEIPTTLQDLMMARLDRMEGEREVAQLAAALGREFTYEVLAAATALDESTVQAELTKLVQAEILYPKGRPPRCTYIFKHALLEDALYNALVKGKRQQFHRQIAEVLEAQFAQTAETRPELIAHHFSEAGLTEKGVGYWLKAALRSRERSADHEAIGHLTKGLALLDTLEETPERDDRELQFLGTLGPTYIAVHGYAAPEVGPILHRARELCERIDRPTQLFGIMLGTWEWRLVRGDIRLCMDLARDGMALAERLNDPGMLMEALFMPGVTMFYRGEFASARACYERALAEYEDRERTKFWAAYTGHNASVTHRCYLALALWQLGYPDQALKIAREAHELARTIGHAFSLAHAVDFTACLYHDCRLGIDLQAAAEEEIAIATEQGFQLWHALGTLHKAAAMLLQSRLGEGVPLLLEGIDAFRATGAGLRLPYYFSMLGEAYTQVGRFEDARKALDEGLAVAEQNDDRFQEAELHRLKGELLVAESLDRDQAAGAEDCFRRAIDIAHRQQSRAWELRTTTSLARLWLRQGRGDEARAALAAVYGTYTEGFTTPDLVDARRLLERLADPASECHAR
jgi:TOMM system kinase/cyclase fusion protein